MSTGLAVGGGLLGGLFLGGTYSTYATLQFFLSHRVLFLYLFCLSLRSSFILILIFNFFQIFDVFIYATEMLTGGFGGGDDGGGGWGGDGGGDGGF